MDLSVEAAAARVGVSRTLIYELVSSGALVARGTPLRLAAADVDALITARHREALARVGDLVGFAQEVRDRAQEIGGRRGTWTPLDQDARDVFGPHVVKAAEMREGSGCRWCWARMAASVRGGLEPQLTDAHRLLLGEPCMEDLRAIRDVLFARRGSGQESAVSSPALSAESVVRAHTAAAKPKPRAARYVGSKRCGTPVGTPCSCHPGPKSKAVTASAPLKAKAKAPRRVEPHGCGCTCPEHRGQK
jgi:hypothetical protein